MMLKRIGIGAAVCVALLSILTLGWVAGRAGAQDSTAALLAAQNPLSTGFSYQGYLAQNGTAIDAQCDFQFGLFSDPVGGTRLGALQTVSNVFVVQGRFTVLLNDANQMTADPFTGKARHLEIAVRCPTGGGAYTLLAPRQNLTATPYAMSVRPGATISGTVAANTGALNLGSNRDGLHIIATGGDGVYVDATAGHGLNVSAPDDHGLNVREATNGVYITKATGNGFFINDATSNGIRIVFAGQNGLQLDSYGNIGLQVKGGTDSSLFAASLQGGVLIQGGCTGCTMQALAVNSGSATLAPGDIVTAVGVQDGAPEGYDVVLNVRRAAAGDAPIGVVVGAAEAVAQGDGPDIVAPRPGTAAASGSYVMIVTYGPAQVRVERAASGIDAGARLTVGDGGALRALRTVEVDGVALAESAATLGVALEAVDAGRSALVWVLVNPR